MSTQEQLRDALKDAMRAGDDLRKRTLRMALSAIKLAEVDKGELDESEVLAIIQNEIKYRQETIEDAQRSGRQDLVQESQEEIQVLKAYLPEQLSPLELEEVARQVIEEVGATSMREMGQVMKELVPRLHGRATAQQASQAVRELLA